MPNPEAAAMPPIVAPSGPHPIAATMSGRGARRESSNESGTPDIVEANISADAQPAARPMGIIAIISCPAPFERLDRGQQIMPPYQLVRDLRGGVRTGIPLKRSRPHRGRDDLLRLLEQEPQPINSVSGNEFSKVPGV